MVNLFLLHFASHHGWGWGGGLCEELINNVNERQSEREVNPVSAYSSVREDNTTQWVTLARVVTPDNAYTAVYEKTTQRSELCVDSCRL